MINLDEVNNMYHCYKLLKKKGRYKYLNNGKKIWVKPKYRKITAPNDKLKNEQKRILNEILNEIQINTRASGFVPKKDIRSNAREHVGAEWILELDLKEFFDTITEEEVRISLINNGIDRKSVV